MRTTLRALVLAAQLVGICSLDCYQCNGVQNISDCHNVAPCSTHQNCYVEAADTNGIIAYNLGCKPQQECIANASTLSPIQIVGRDTPTSIYCNRCCDVDACNNKICIQANQPAVITNVCKDDTSFNCAKYSSLLNLCHDKHQAKTVCRKYCRLCDLVDGGWSYWSSWNKCDVTCGNGTIVRTRKCDNPPPSHDGSPCVGDDVQQSRCFWGLCPVHGSWAQWAPWGSCSVTCSIGLQRRDRSCSNPYPDRNGDHCFGDSRDDRACFIRACADGGWSVWAAWGQCTATCNGGIKTRERTCDNPTPSPFGHACMGNNVDKDLCNVVKCPATQVAFSVTSPKATSSVSSMYNPVIPIFTNIIMNIGHGYNVTTGKFVCPISGIYLFSFTMRASQFDINLACNIDVNDFPKTFTQADIKDDSSSVSIYVQLHAGDTVYPSCVDEWERVLNSTATLFNGVLIPN